jgi:hypothetical protein
MAQTRANAKVLRAVLGWVVVLAGYRPHTAEEFDQPNDPRSVDYVAALRQSLLAYAKGDKRRASEILKELTGKRLIADVNQREARRAIHDFESLFLGAEAENGLKQKLPQQEIRS